MAGQYDEVPLSSLRWPVTLAQRVQAPDGDGSTVETLINPVTVHASIESIGMSTFWGATQIEGVSHRIRMRWQAYLDQTFVVIRVTATPDGESRSETFRVRRVKEIGGRKRFVEIEAMLEGASYQ